MLWLARFGPHPRLQEHACRDDDISDVMREVTALAHCNCEQITKYHDSFILPGTSKLLISMELMACSGSDLVRLFLTFLSVEYLESSQNAMQ
jgi:hypothetical protein